MKRPGEVKRCVIEDGRGEMLPQKEQIRRGHDRDFAALGKGMVQVSTLWQGSAPGASQG